MHFCSGAPMYFLPGVDTKFRPDAPEGVKGWSAKGELRLEPITRGSGLSVV